MSLPCVSALGNSNDARRSTRPPTVDQHRHLPRPHRDGTERVSLTVAGDVDDVFADRQPHARDGDAVGEELPGAEIGLVEDLR